MQGTSIKFMDISIFKLIVNNAHTKLILMHAHILEREDLRKKGISFIDQLPTNGIFYNGLSFKLSNIIYSTCTDSQYMSFNYGLAISAIYLFSFPFLSISSYILSLDFGPCKYTIINCMHAVIINT